MADNKDVVNMNDNLSIDKYINKNRDNRKIGEILLEDFNIPRHYIEEILLKKEKSGNKERFGQLAIKLGLINEEIVYKALAKQLGIEYLSNIEAENRIVWDLFKNKYIYGAFGENEDNLISLIRTHKAFPAYIDFSDPNNITLVVAISNYLGDNFAFKSYLKKYYLGFQKSEKEAKKIRANYDVAKSRYIIEKKLKKTGHNKLKNEGKLPEIIPTKIKEVLVSPSIYDKFELKYKGITEEEIQSFNGKIALDDTELSNDEKISVETYLKMLLTYGIINDVSDIHLEPSLDAQFRISVRIRGTRKTLDFVDIETASRLIGVIKTKANMNSQNIRAPQDGSIDGSKFLVDYKLPIFRGVKKEKPEFSFPKNSFRISTYPTAKPAGGIVDGASYESTVIRILASSNGMVDLKTLGLSPQVEKELMFAISRNQGIVLIVGPTGSGKSTTLYSTLSKIDPIQKKIISFEDPVEIRNMYWAQGERNVTDAKEINFDFLEAKKAILRQDPDVILMGETRDEESAKFAIEAANTGHLVFTTLHANSCAAAFERMVKLEVKPLELASSVLAVISQRLVKKVCPHCHTVEKIKPRHIEFLRRLEMPDSKIPEQVVLANPNGCPMCGYSGYVGRTLLDEVIPVNSEIKFLITNGAAEFEIRKKASELGYKTMLENGLEKMKQKLVSIEDIIKVV